MIIFAVVLLFTAVLSAVLWDAMFIPLILVLLGTVGMFVVAKKYTIWETVTMDKAGITSNTYRRINFADIKAVRSFSVHRGSTIEVILKNGKSIDGSSHYSCRWKLIVIIIICFINYPNPLMRIEKERKDLFMKRDDIRFNHKRVSMAPFARLIKA